MNNNLRQYIDDLFSEAPLTKKTVEVKEEILQNLIDKYNDMLEEGKSEEAAYNIAVASIGDISELVAELKGPSTYPGGPASPEREAARKKSAILTAIAVAMYILSVVPVLLLDDEYGIITMFIMIALATGIIIYNNMTKPSAARHDETIAEEFKEWRESNSDKSKVFRSLSSALWAIIVVVYVIVSFTTFAWHITWVIFLIGAALTSILKAAFELRK